MLIAPGIIKFGAIDVDLKLFLGFFHEFPKTYNIVQFSWIFSIFRIYLIFLKITKITKK